MISTTTKKRCFLICLIKKYTMLGTQSILFNLKKTVAQLHVFFVVVVVTEHSTFEYVTFE